MSDFSVSDLSKLFQELHFAKPNSSRLNSKIKACREFVRGTAQGKYKIHQRKIQELREKFPNLDLQSEEIQTVDSVLPESLYLRANRTYLTKLSQQINACFINNCFDACAVMMRRLLEVLLIHTYENFRIEASIKDANTNNYFMLNSIINDAKQNSTIGLSRNCKESLDDFKKVGNFSAHRIHYSKFKVKSQIIKK